MVGIDLATRGLPTRVVASSNEAFQRTGLRPAAEFGR
jgi:hypothetical protein